jgi:hypothetical protein
VVELLPEVIEEAEPEPATASNTPASPASPAEEDWEWPAEGVADEDAVREEPAASLEERSADRPQVTLEAYGVFSGRLTPASDATRDELIEGVQAIVAAEGPVSGDRIHRLYVQSSGGTRVGSQVARLLNSAVSLAVRRGALLADDPLGRSGVRPRTYRLPDQPLVRVRELGPRDLGDVPPRELATVMRELADRQGWDDEEALFRGVLAQLGLKKLTKNVSQIFSAVLGLARALESEGQPPRVEA